MQNNYFTGKTKIIPLCIIAIVIFMSFNPIARAEKVYIMDSYNKRHIYIKKGDVLEISLRTDILPNHIWEKISGDERILLNKNLNQNVQAGVNTKSKFTFSYRAISTGKTRLHLIYHIYHQPFERNIADKRSFEISVTVK